MPQPSGSSRGQDRPGCPKTRRPGRWPAIPPAPATCRRCGPGGRPRAMWQMTPECDAERGLGGRPGQCGPGLRRKRPRCGDRGARPARPRAAHRRPAQRPWDPAGFAVLVAEAGPAARYRAFLAARRGEVRVVIGNRAAAYAPVERARPGRSLRRRRRPAVRAACALPAHPGRAGAAGRPGRRRECCSPATPHGRGADLAGTRLAAPSWPRTGPRSGTRRRRSR